MKDHFQHRNGLTFHSLYKLGDAEEGMSHYCEVACQSCEQLEKDEEMKDAKEMMSCAAELDDEHEEH